MRWEDSVPESAVGLEKPLPLTFATGSRGLLAGGTMRLHFLDSGGVLDMLGSSRASLLAAFLPGAASILLVLMATRETLPT